MRRLPTNEDPCDDIMGPHHYPPYINAATLELQPLRLSQQNPSRSLSDSQTSRSNQKGEMPWQDEVSLEFHHQEQQQQQEHRNPSEISISLIDDDATKRQVELLTWENLAIPACYLAVGIAQGVFSPLLNVYPLDLGATEAQQTTLSSVTLLPAAFKVLYGFLSDNVPWFGYRRKPYMMAGWSLASFTMLLLVLTSDLTLSYHSYQANADGGDSQVAVPPARAPSIQALSAIFFLFGGGMWLADVMADSMVAQKARLEPEETRGSLQSTCYACRFFGLMIAAPISTVCYSHLGPGSLIKVLMVAPLLLLPLVVLLHEDRDEPIKPTADQCREIWNTVCQRSVWQPMGFLYLFNLLQVSNAAWRQFLKTVLGFTADQLNSLLVASYVLLYCGTMIYKVCFLHTSWRRIYQVCIILNAFFSSLQLLLIRGITLGMSPFLFAMGDDAFREFLSGIQFLPCAILMVSLCPTGSEGASYAMFTTVWNSAMMISPALSTMLLPIWDVSKEALQDGDLEGLFNLSLLTTVIQLSPIVLVRLLPHGRDELAALSEGSSSAVGGGIFLAILFGSMLYTFAVTVLNILVPGWSGGS